MQYTVILSPEETGYSVFCPAFHIASQGDSRDEALSMIVAAMEGWIEGELEDGRDVPLETLGAIAEEIVEVLRFRDEEGLPPIIETTQVTVRSRAAAA